MKSIITRAVRVQRTARLIQFAGKFDLDAGAGKVRETIQAWDVDVALPEAWSVGVIVGPSMAGKTTIAGELFPGELVEQGHWPWPADRFIGDGFPKAIGVDEIAGLLSSVGFSSPPDWMKPYAALSNGGKFRVDLARTLAEALVRARETKDGPALRRAQGRAVIDEFGSLVHREARQVAAAAASKAARRLGLQLVALCVHDDAVPFFEPDWVIHMKPGQPVRAELPRGRLCRPDIELEIFRTDRSAWPLFASSHYLSGEIHPASACYVGLIADQPAAFTAVIAFPHARRPGWREHRTVCLPTFQGIGLGTPCRRRLRLSTQRLGVHTSARRHTPRWCITVGGRRCGG